MSEEIENGEMEVPEVQEETAFIQKEMNLEVVENGNVQMDTAEPEGEESAAPVVEEDRTEDQVPDITGTEGVDPMTTSMDGIEDLPAAEETHIHETIVEEMPDQLENPEETPIEEEAAPTEEAPVEEAIPEEPVAEEAPAEEPVPEEAPVEEAPVEEIVEVPVAEEEALEPVPEEAAVEEEPPVKEEPAPEEPEIVEAPVEEAPAEEPVAEEAVPEEPAPEEEAPVEEAPVEEAPVEEAPVEEALVEEEPVAEEEPAAEEEAKEFELSAPPEGKRPRTPNELDEPAEEFVDAPMTPVPEESAPQTPAPEASAPQTPAIVTPAPSTPKSATRMNGSIPGTPKSATTKSPGATATPTSKTAFDFEETPATPRSAKAISFEDEAPTTPTKSLKTPRTPRTPRSPKSPKTPKAEEPVEAAPEPEPEEPEIVEAPMEEAPAEEPEAEEPVAEEPVSEEPAAEEPEAVEEPIAEKEEVQEVEAPRERARRASPSPSPPPRAARRAQSPSPTRREAPARDHVCYDEDSYRTVPPPRMPTSRTFSSWTPAEKDSYTAISPFVSSTKYTSDSSYKPASHLYTSFFDDVVAAGAFSNALYATSRVVERSRSRARERRNAMRSQRSASNYYRYTAQLPAPLRSRDYSTPPTYLANRPPSRAGSFTSFIDYSASKNHELSRQGSRTSLYDSAMNLSRSSSRSNVDLYLGAGRLSRVDSYVRDMDKNYEFEVPAAYERYRSSSRPSRGYDSYSGGYEDRIGHLERSLSREQIQKEKIRHEYSALSGKLDQAMRQMELLRSSSYAAIRTSHAPRTSVFGHFYPYY